jgi:hypothetical protein
VGPVRFARTQLPPDEVVALDDGTVDVDVTPLSANERFRIVTGDSEVEVRGTSFRVIAQRAELTAVYVSQGRVDVRRRGERPITLGHGEQWMKVRDGPPRTTEPVGSGLEPVASKVHGTGANHTKLLASRHRVHETAASTLGERRVSLSTTFDEGWRLLRAGHPAEAAAKFDEIEKRSTAADLVEDAMFWRAVALGRLERASDARTALERFLGRFPSSGHRGEAAVMLGWNLLEHGGPPEAARRLFESAANDPLDRVRVSARLGLARAGAD